MIHRGKDHSGAGLREIKSTFRVSGGHGFLPDRGKNGLGMQQGRAASPAEEPNVGKELRQMPAEPLLPVEKKLIGWSLGVGAVLLVILVCATEALFP
jgi:hypothetical protein